MDLQKAPLEDHVINGRTVTVYRADSIPKPPLAPYLKTIEIASFLQNLAKKYKLLGYYSVPESEWVVSLPPMAKELGMKAIIGMSSTKKLPWYAPQIPEENLYLVSPNMYKINYSRTKKHVESLGGLMVPMGLECREVVNGLTEFLKTSPIPLMDNIVVPVGSGVALSGILNHLNNKSKVFGICTRSSKSVLNVVKKYVVHRNYILKDREAECLIDLEYPFPMHRFWDANAFSWLKENMESLKGSICFINLGRGNQKR